MKQFIQLFLVAIIAVFFSLVVYSSANARLWNIFIQQYSQLFEGTVKTDQLSPWKQDLAYAWANDIYYVIAYSGGHESISQGLIEYPFGITLEAELLAHYGGLPRVLLVVFIAWLVVLLALCLATRFSMSTRHTGLSKDLLSSSETQRFRDRLQKKSLLIVLIGMPLVSLVSWYFTYDRHQSSWDNRTNQPRNPRYILDSFHPLISEWFFILLTLFVVIFVFVYSYSKCFISKIPVEHRLEHQRFCPNRNCRYLVDQSILVCPECGKNWREVVSKKSISPLIKRRKAVAVISAVLLVVSIFITAVFVPYHRIQSWLTLRQDQILTQSLYLVQLRPVELEWGQDHVCFVSIPVDPSHPRDGCYIVYQVNDQELKILDSVEFSEREDLVLEGKKVAVLLAYNYVSYCTIDIHSTPDRVVGFPMDEPLSHEAKQFLDQASTLFPSHD